MLVDDLLLSVPDSVEGSVVSVVVIGAGVPTAADVVDPRRDADDAVCVVLGIERGEDTTALSAAAYFAAEAAAGAGSEGVAARADVLPSGGYRRLVTTLADGLAIAD